MSSGKTDRPTIVCHDKYPAAGDGGSGKEAELYKLVPDRCRYPDCFHCVLPDCMASRVFPGESRRNAECGNLPTTGNRKKEGKNDKNIRDV
jgi:hypothetical protein